jgi:hypothetical protein
MGHLSAAVATALVAYAAIDANAGIQKDKMGPPPLASDLTVNKAKTADKAWATNGRYFEPTEEVVLEDFSLTALGDGFAETDDVTLDSNMSWAFRVDFQVRHATTNAVRSDSFDLIYSFSGQFDGSGQTGAFGGSGVMLPNAGTVLGIPLFSEFNAPAGAVQFHLDAPIWSTLPGQSLTASYLDTSANGVQNLTFDIAPMFGGGTEYMMFAGDAIWTRIPAPGSLWLAAGAAVGMRRRRQPSV